MFDIILDGAKTLLGAFTGDDEESFDLREIQKDMGFAAKREAALQLSRDAERRSGVSKRQVNPNEGPAKKSQYRQQLVNIYRPMQDSGARMALINQVERQGSITPKVRAVQRNLFEKNETAPRKKQTVIDYNKTDPTLKVVV